VTIQDYLRKLIQSIAKPVFQGNIPPKKATIRIPNARIVEVVNGPIPLQPHRQMLASYVELVDILPLLG